MDPVAAALIAYATTTCGAARVDVAWTGVAAGLVPEGAALVWDGDPCHGHPRLKLTPVVDGVPVASLSVRPSLAVWVDGPVAAADVAAGAPGETVAGQVLIDGVVGEPVVGSFVARVPIRAGEPVTSAVVAIPVDGSAGEPVDVIVRRGDLVIVSAGRLLQDARVGEGVRVAIAATGASANAVMTAPGRVELR